MRFTEHITVEEPTETVDAIGGRSATWATLDTVRGHVAPLQRGHEAQQADGRTGQVGYTVTVRADQLEAATVSISSLTESSGTATATATSHGLTTGDYAIVAGADQDDYNGRHQVTVTDANTYTFAVSNSPTTPATGTITSSRLVPWHARLRLSWVPRWDADQAARTLEILAVRLTGRHIIELDCGEAA